ncbi:MAG: glyoxalase, partial [Gammaproteobacteria bacterium]|nr:glyoxalase [Gammaproteobacteria bacterium]
GLEIDNSRPDLGYPGAWLAAGAQQIHLLELKDEGAECHDGHGGRDRHIALLVDELESLRQALEKENINYTMSRSGRKALFCRDPDGNALEFIVSV